MLAPERHRHILQTLEQREAVRVTELADALQVSDMTIRRDIDVLASSGSLRRIHGGARRIAALTAVEPGFAANVGRAVEAKRTIASAAVELVSAGMTIALTGGSTTYHLAAYLGGIPGLTVVTNSLRAADALHQQQEQDADRAQAKSDIGEHFSSRRNQGPVVIITGGERTPSEALVGPVATAAISSLHVDLCFMGVHGIHPVQGLTTPNLLEAETNRAFAAAAEKLVVLADRTKFGRAALARIAALDRVGTLVSDVDPDCADGHDRATDPDRAAGPGTTYKALIPRILVAPTGKESAR